MDGERELGCFVCGHCDIEMLGEGGSKVLLKENGEEIELRNCRSDVRCGC